uniref:Uncharacterized protein n=1 Tax=Oryzias melastigma TaxID=30732 RepID=A0A3B3BCZ1_ORYME
MAPFPVIDLLVAGFQLRFPRAHIDQQLPAGFLLLRALRPTVAEQQKAAGLHGAEVKGDGACLFGVPLWQGDVGLWGFKGHGVQSGHILTTEHKISIQGDLGVTLDGQPGQLQLKIVVLVDNL